MAQDSCHQGRSRAGGPDAPAGFIILIVLAVLATMSVLLSSQLSAVQSQETMQVRMSEESKARALAEHCVQVADAYVVDYATRGSFVDFDRILDPTDDSPANDDYMPPVSLMADHRGVVYLPPQAPDTALFRYRAFNVPEPEGTCFVRYDDNLDDVNPRFDDLATNNTGGVSEGKGINVPNRDRDRTVIITVIAAIPQRADLEDTFRDAHARVTLRRVRAMPPPSGSGVQAGGSVTLASGSICGDVGGVTADTVSGACVCGQVNAEVTSGTVAPTSTTCTRNADCGSGASCDLASNTCTCPGCDSCASTGGSSTIPGDRPPPIVNIPAAVTSATLLSNEAIGGSGTAGNHIANLGAAAVYARDNGTTTDVFAWDTQDANTNTTLLNKVYQSDGSAFAAQDCTSAGTVGSSDPIPDPCTWDLDAKTVTCTASQTPCWKLVARLGD